MLSLAQRHSNGWYAMGYRDRPMRRTEYGMVVHLESRRLSTANDDVGPFKSTFPALRQVFKLE